MAANTDEPLFDAAGVDLTLVRACLDMTPSERLDALQRLADFILETDAPLR